MIGCETVKSRPPASGFDTVKVRLELVQVPSVTAGRAPLLPSILEHSTPVAAVSPAPGW